MWQDRDPSQELEISPDEIAEYLSSTGWKEDTEGTKWQVFRGFEDIHGDDLEIVLPKNREAYDIESYKNAAVSLLALVRNENPDTVLSRIENVNRDVLLVRNIDAKSKNSISIALAATQVGKLRTLIRQASYSEGDASPSYQSKYKSTLADRMVEEFQFGHTQAGSFGLRVKTPELSAPMQFRQLSLIKVEAIEPDSPVPRRIVERIVRGLIATKEAVRNQRVEQLAHNYQSGFNANMCDAIVNISRNKAPSVEYSVMWSPKIAAPEDLAGFGPALLMETDYTFLEEAAKMMKDLETEDTFTVRGLVHGLSAEDAPYKLDSGQAIVVSWEKPDSRQNVKIIISLEPDDYLKAVEAHSNWHPVQVIGEAKLIGNRWRLANPRDFRVVGPGA
jgi:hypothetical protein